MFFNINLDRHRFWALFAYQDLTPTASFDGVPSIEVLHTDLSFQGTLQVVSL